jgi:hypothetical protein
VFGLGNLTTGTKVSEDLASTSGESGKSSLYIPYEASSSNAEGSSRGRASLERLIVHSVRSIVIVLKDHSEVEAPHVSRVGG